MDFQEIYTEFQPRILHYLSRMMGPEEAEDVVQEVFEKVNRGLDGFRGQSKLSTWIYRIATNTAIDKLRSASFKQSASQAALEEAEGAKAQNTWTGQAQASIDQTVIRKEMSECVREYIDRLPPDYSTILILSEIEGFKNKEVADILQISLENVKVRLHRARDRLKKELDNGCDFYHNEEGALACDRKPVQIESKKSPQTADGG
ncbi:MAG: sigma-70 family RNA polymerase sigma factor [Deltaproteobacteria bacterium]|jgi:RNA polymerase sigma-70 factor (ECF subfamily)|nr:sigma-70 family RNA polymerase sigma factor [Deltaproteobacteria bacterium]